MADPRFYPKNDETALVVIDVQERISAVMDQDDLEKITDNIIRLLKGMEILESPYFFTEQYTKGLGPTIEKLQPFKQNVEHLEKMYFSCCRDIDLVDKLKNKSIRYAVLCGMETHVCVLQTALDLLKEGFFVHVVSDAVISRFPSNRITGLELLRDAGAVITSTETILFQLQEKCGTDRFKAISKLVR